MWDEKGAQYVRAPRLRVGARRNPTVSALVNMIDFVIRDSDIQGSGVFAKKAFRKGKGVYMLKGKAVHGKAVDRLVDAGKLRADDAFQVGTDTYLVLEPLSMAFNHSCNPNMGVRAKSGLFALRDIAIGEELTYDYSTVVGVGNNAWSMQCNCGATQCRSRIGSWQSLPAELRDQYFSVGAFPDFVLKEI